eukprot:434569-Rhodomonas_salina.3
MSLTSFTESVQLQEESYTQVEQNERHVRAHVSIVLNMRADCQTQSETIGLEFVVCRMWGSTIA